MKSRLVFMKDGRGVTEYVTWELLAGVMQKLVSLICL